MHVLLALAMVTHARLQSELQVRDPLAWSVALVSFISCPLLLKRKAKKRRKSIGEGSKANRIHVFVTKSGCSWVDPRRNLESCLHRAGLTAAVAAQAV